MCTGCLLIGDHNDRVLIILTKTTSLSLGHLLAIISSKTYQWGGQVTRWSLLWELLTRNLLLCFVINNVLVCILILKVSDLLYVITVGHTVTACMLPIANSLTTSPISSPLVTLLLFWSHHFLDPRCLKFGPMDQYMNAVYAVQWHFIYLRLICILMPITYNKVCRRHPLLRLYWMKWRH